MCSQPSFKIQRGATLVELLVGIIIGLLVVMAAVGALVMARGFSRSAADSASLEQQATLAMLQIGQQINQTGALNAYVSGSDPDHNTLNAAAGRAPGASVTGGKIEFDTRPAGVSNARPATVLFGEDAVATRSDALTISYAAPNDGSMQANCVGNFGGNTAPIAGGSGRIVSRFYVPTGTRQLMCSDDGGDAQPIVNNVVDMRVKYFSVKGAGAGATVTTSPNAAAVNASSGQWAAINGVQVCLEMVGDSTQAPKHTLLFDCKDSTGAALERDDRSVHRIVQSTFFLPNVQP